MAVVSSVCPYGLWSRKTGMISWYEACRPVCVTRNIIRQISRKQKNKRGGLTAELLMSRHKQKSVSSGSRSVGGAVKGAVATAATISLSFGDIKWTHFQCHLGFSEHTSDWQNVYICFWHWLLQQVFSVALLGYRILHQDTTKAKKTSCVWSHVITCMIM